MDFATIWQRLQSYEIGGFWPESIFLLPEDAIADIYEFVASHQLHWGLELGCGFGTTSCVMAAAVAANGGGKVVACDRQLYESVNPYRLQEHTQVGDTLEVAIEPLGYNWYLADLIAKQTQDNICTPIFDFCFLDGAHQWETDGLAFALVAKLLKPGGWIVFDDLNFVLRGCIPNWREEFGHLSDRELDTPQVEMVYELLVKQHPDFTDFAITHGGRMGWARKRESSQISATEQQVKHLQNSITQLQAELLHQQAMIAAMKSSKFWRLRSSWLKMKKFLHLPTTEEMV
ncbi:class I SAM-dependent methyltransferase [Geitlerinema sp. PCC 9228]|jgi:predicted O-methyltransferase YrrM|uniref:class I SAM-dependent methyltransferase n=1 Tax=Geitlerinema sp. PCC 9228 TaxID=111611 RepID=UPI0008F9933E|nr:class I SAM-dependent methyltransferase [Geitlerinema sp. PCC 9228]